MRARGAIRAALRDDGIAARIDSLVDDLLGPDIDRPLAPQLPRHRSRDRDRLLAEARDHSRSLRDDPREQTLLDELDSIQADNADVDE